MTRRLYLMRHGQTLFNVQRLIQGASDSPLTEEGIEQARQAGLRLARHRIEVDYYCCSTSERACDTLELVMQGLLGDVVPYDRLKGLKEFNRGLFEGESLDLMPHDLAQRNEFFVPFGGESDDESLERMVATLTGVMLGEGHERVLAVSHGGVCREFQFYVTGSYGTDHLPNCGVMCYDFEPDASGESGDFTCVGSILPEEDELGARL